MKKEWWSYQHKQDSCWLLKEEVWSEAKSPEMLQWKSLIPPEIPPCVFSVCVFKKVFKKIVYDLGAQDNIWVW